MAQMAISMRDVQHARRGATRRSCRVERLARPRPTRADGSRVAARFLGTIFRQLTTHGNPLHHDLEASGMNSISATGGRHESHA